MDQTVWRVRVPGLLCYRTDVARHRRIRHSLFGAIHTVACQNNRRSRLLYKDGGMMSDDEVKAQKPYQVRAVGRDSTRLDSSLPGFDVPARYR
jgi:hypothetical protein